MYQVVVSDPHGNEYTYQLVGGPGSHATVGRRLTNDIVLGKATVSRHHATLTVHDDHVTLEVHSSNGVIFRSQTTHALLELHPGDSFRIDTYTLRLERTGDTQPMDSVVASPSVMHDGRVTDHALLNRLDDKALVGHRFCFVERAALMDALPAWMRVLTDPTDSSDAVVIPLFGDGPVELPGATITPPRFADVRVRSVTSDRALYRELKDVVELLVYAPGADREGALQVRRNGADFGVEPYRADPFGVARVSIQDLPAGTYEIAFRDADEDEPPCEFTVASFQLAGLTATLLDRSLEDETLHVRIGLESYGLPVEGAVRLALVSGGERVEEGEFVADAGTVEASFQAKGEGPFDVEVQLVDDPARTATVRIVGTRRAEREETLVSAVDREMFASLVPREGARDIRGLWVTEAGHRVSLFELDEIECDPARLKARTDIAQAAVVMLEPGRPPRHVGSQALAKDEVWEIPLPDQANTAILAIGAMTTDGRAWEGWTLVSAPRDEDACEVVVPDEARPGETVEIAVRWGDVSSGVAYFVIKDQRLITPDTPSNRLAGAIKRWADEADALLGAGFVDTSLAAALPKTRDQRAYTNMMANYSFGGPGQSQSYGRPQPPPSVMQLSEHAEADVPAPRAMQAPTGLPGGAPPKAGSPPEGAAPPAPSAEPEDAGEATTEDANVFFVGIARIANGEATVEVELPDGFADVTVEVFVADEHDWGSAEKTFRVERTPYVAVELPPFVHRDDTARGIVTAFSGGRMSIAVTRDDTPVELTHNGGSVPAEIEEPRAEVEFEAGPGTYEISVRDLDTDEGYAVEKTVTEPGKLRAIARTIRILEPGERVTTEEDGVLQLKVLPALEEPFEMLCDATANYSHLCIEQTSAKIVSACAMYVFAGDDHDRRTNAKRIITAGIRRVERMHLPGRGFKTYPSSAPRPDNHWGKMAVGYLRFLHVVNTNDVGLTDTLQRGIAMATDASAGYGIEFPPANPSTPQDVYLKARFSQSDADRAAAAASARKWATEPPQPAHHYGRVAARMDRAWTAATLFRAGEPTDISTALMLTNEVVADLNPQGRLYSTADSVAAIALMAELTDAGVAGEAGIVEVDGREVATSEATAVDKPREVLCQSGRAIVEVTRLVEEDWEAFRPDADARVRVERDGRSTSRLTAGSSADLVVELVDAYETGDVLWVCLPPALSRVEGGGQVKLFSVDFAEQTSLRVPLAATASTSGEKQHFMICVRNMFKEERVANPGALTISVD